MPNRVIVRRVEPREFSILAPLSMRDIGVVRAYCDVFRRRDGLQLNRHTRESASKF